jgi:two-component system, cell cycle response regulator CpdR
VPLPNFYKPGQICFPQPDASVKLGADKIQVLPLQNILLGGEVPQLLEPGTRIMVIDDEYDIVFIIRRHLEKWGYSVDTFTNPLYALEVFKAHPGRYSVVLTDISMPEIRGTTLAKTMQKLKPGLRVIVMTAYEIEPSDLATNLPTVKRDDILKKPFTLEEVCGAVKKQLQTS